MTVFRHLLSHRGSLSNAAPTITATTATPIMLVLFLAIGRLPVTRVSTLAIRLSCETVAPG